MFWRAGTASRAPLGLGSFGVWVTSQAASPELAVAVERRRGSTSYPCPAHDRLYHHTSGWPWRGACRAGWCSTSPAPQQPVNRPVRRSRARTERRIQGQAVAMTIRSVGVEEELLLVEPGTGKPLAVAETALRTMDTDDGRQGGTQGDAGESLEFELQRQQLETSTKPCFELSELSEELRHGRSLAAEVAGRVGARVAA